MKKAVLFIAILLTGSFLFAQEFQVKYSMDFTSTDSEVQAQLGMLQGSTLSIYTKENKSRIENSMGGIMSTTTVIDSDKKKGVMLMDGMMGKQASTFNLDEYLEGEEEDTDYEFQLTGETKTILGRKCKQGVIYTEDGVELTYWFAEDIQVKEGMMGHFIKRGVPGLPLEFSIEQPEMTMKFVATEFNEKVEKPKTLFNLSVPKGYSKLPFEQLKSIGSM